MKSGKKFTLFDLYKSIWYFLEKHRLKYLVWNIIIMSVFFLQMLPTYMIGLIVDFLTNYKEGASLFLFYAYIIGIAVVFAVTSIVRLTAKYHLDKCDNDINYNIRVKGFDKIINLSLIKNREEASGAKLQKIQSGTDAYRTLSTLFYDKLYPSVISFFATIIYFIMIKPFYLIFLILFFLFFFILMKIFSKKLEILNYNRNKSLEDASGTILDGLRNILTIKSSGSENAFKNHITGKEFIKKKFDDKIVSTNNLLWKIYQLLCSLFIFVFLFFLGKDVLGKIISVGSIVTFFNYFIQIQLNSRQIIAINQTVINAKTQFGRMMPVFDSNIEDKKKSFFFPENWQNITITNGFYKHVPSNISDKVYGGLNNFNLKIKRNHKIGIVGHSGCGKSTLARVILGLYPLQEGFYKIDNINFYDIKTEDVFNNIYLVLQETEMFNLSLKDNITLINDFDNERFNKAIEISHLNDIISRLPDGINTVIGEQGNILSGGERQRIAIARAVYKNSGIIIFDEATSSLDVETEEIIQRNLEKQLENKTLIFIAHRLSTLKNVDTIYVIDNGKIIDNLKYDELFGKNEKN